MQKQTILSSKVSVCSSHNGSNTVTQDDKSVRDVNSIPSLTTQEDASSAPTLLSVDEPAIIHHDSGPSNVLLIGLSFNRSIMDQMKSNGLQSLTDCKDNKGKALEQSVLRDTWRCSQIEAQFPKSKVYTCSILQDSIREIDDSTNLNCSCNSTTFVKQIMSRNWTFNEIYVDTFRMPNSYLKEKFHIGFINNLVSLARLPKLVGTASSEGVIYLPFCPHFFYQVHTSDMLKKAYSISYLKEKDLGPQNHKLAHVTLNASKKVEEVIFGKSIVEQNKNITFSLRAMKSLAPGEFLVESSVAHLLRGEDNVEEIRYIVLTVIPDRNIADLSLTSNDTVSPYSIHTDSIIRLSSELSSLQVILPLQGDIAMLCKKVIQTLMEAKPNTPEGIAIVADKPMNNGVQLNINRRAVLRQYYGDSFGMDENGISLRAAFGFKNGRQSEGTDTRRIFVKPFCGNMRKIATLLNKMMLENASLLGVHKLNLKHSFNSCTVLLYHRIPGMKDISSMGWHTDCKYSKCGKFSKASNYQMENTPTVILTLGSSRVLHWRKKLVDMECKLKSSKSFLKMVLREGTVLILNPKDECPHYNDTDNGKVKYEHGNVKIGKDETSIGLVFRVVPNYVSVNITDNRLVCSSIRPAESKIVTEMDKQYASVDVELVHKFMKEKYSNILID